MYTFLDRYLPVDATRNDRCINSGMSYRLILPIIHTYETTGLQCAIDTRESSLYLSINYILRRSRWSTYPSFLTQELRQRKQNR